MSFTADIKDVVEENRNGLLGKRSHWKRVRLGEVASILNGAPFESSRFKKDRGTPLIRIRDVVRGHTETYYDGEFDHTYLVQHGDLLVGMDGDFNCEPWAGQPALLNQRVCKIAPDESRYAKQFLRYVLPGYLAAINERTPSITVKHLSSRTVADIPLPFPPLLEQRQIVAEIEKQFTRLDAAVAALRRVQANLKRYRAAVLKAACEGRLVPTEAELARDEGRTYETGEQLLARILADRRKNWPGRGKYKEPAAPGTTNLPSLPEGWTWATCAQIGEAITGFTPPKSNPEFFGGDVPFFKPTDLDAGYNVREFRDSLTEAGAQHGRVLPPLSILVTCIGATIGKTGLARVRCTTNLQINALVVPDGSVSPKYVYWYFYGPFGQRQILDNASATTLPILNKSRFEALSIRLPPLTEQTRIVAEVERRLSVIEELEAAVTANLQRATHLRQSILQKAFSDGQVPSAG